MVLSRHLEHGLRRLLLSSKEQDPCVLLNEKFESMMLGQRFYESSLIGAKCGQGWLAKASMRFRVKRQPSVKPKVLGTSRASRDQRSQCGSVDGHGLRFIIGLVHFCMVGCKGQLSPLSYLAMAMG